MTVTQIIDAWDQELRNGWTSEDGENLDRVIKAFRDMRAVLQFYAIRAHHHSVLCSDGGTKARELLERMK